MQSYSVIIWPLHLTTIPIYVCVCVEFLTKAFLVALKKQIHGSNLYFEDKQFKKSVHIFNSNGFRIWHFPMLDTLRYDNIYN